MDQQIDLSTKDWRNFQTTKLTGKHTKKTQTLKLQNTGLKAKPFNRIVKRADLFSYLYLT